MIETLTFLDKLVLIGQVFLQIAINFWPVLIIGALVCVGIARQEARATRR
jgi:hypothetical protein